MPVLSKQARDLISTCRGALRPTDADRDRVEGCLRAILGEAVLPVTAVAVPTVSSLSWKTVLVGAISVGLVGGIFATAFESRTRHATRDAHAGNAPVLSALVLSSSQDVLAPPPANAAPPAESANTAQSTTPPRARDQLAQEVALLTHATSALNAGRIREALSVLAEHERRFPEGALSIERRGAKAKALCALGRASEARVEIARLPPDSLAAARGDQNCGAQTAR